MCSSDLSTGAKNSHKRRSGTESAARAASRRWSGVPRETETTGSTPTSRTAAIPHRQRCRRIRKWHISRAVIMSQDGHHLSARSSRALYRRSVTINVKTTASRGLCVCTLRIAVEARPKMHRNLIVSSVARVPPFRRNFVKIRRVVFA